MVTARLDWHGRTRLLLVAVMWSGPQLYREADNTNSPRFEQLRP